MQELNRVKAMLDEVLHLEGRSADWTVETPLLGSVAELDSMAVVQVIGGIEQTFGVMIEDDEISAEIFATVGALTAFIQEKLAQR